MRAPWIHAAWLLCLLPLMSGCMHPLSRAEAAGEAAMTAAPVDFFALPAGAVDAAEETYTTRDGLTLRYLHYAPTAPNGMALVYLHGIESHAGWFEGPAVHLARLGYDVYLLDRRGSGLNRTGAGLTPGHVERYDVLLDDIRSFRNLLPADRPVGLVALSWGGKLAVAYALRHPEDFESLILITPGLVPQVDVSPLQKLGIGFALLFQPKQRFRSPIEPEMFTNDPQTLALIRRDPQRLRRATARFFWESRRLDGFIERGIGRLNLPVLLLLAGEDVIIDNTATAALLARAQSPLLTIRRYSSLPHSLQFAIPNRMARDMHDWIDEGLAATAPQPFAGQQE